MVVLAKPAVREAASKYQTCAKALYEWYDVARAADWKDFLAVKQTYRNTDYVAPDRLVFDVCGNRLRVVTLVHFSTRTLYILFIGSHAEYDRLDIGTI
jgi:mRNA interferase HigB